MKEQSKIDKGRDLVLPAIIPSFREKSILLGLMSPKVRQEIYFEEKFDVGIFSVERRVLPNNFARLDILFVAGEVAGTILCCELSKNLYHMVGMYVLEKFRSKKYSVSAQENLSEGKPASGKPISPAAFLLKTFSFDIIAEQKQVSLEVLDSNIPAWKLYEKKHSMGDADQKTICFELMHKEQITSYAKIRGKNIGRWHNILFEGEAENLGVQWSHVPDFGGTSRWSINRLYILKAQATIFPIISVHQRFGSWVKVLSTILLYGAPISFISRKFFGEPE